MARPKVSRAERLEALRMTQEVMRVEREGAKLAKQITIAIREQALDAWERRQALQIDQQAYAALIAQLEKAMRVSALLGLRRMVLQNKEHKPALQLDFLDDTLARLSALLTTYYADEIAAVSTLLGRRVVSSAVELVKGALQETQEQVRATVNELIRTGATVRTGVEELRDTFDRVGLTGRAYRLETIFRTQTQLAYNAAAYTAAQQPAIQEILWGYKYITVGDDRVRPEHDAWDGVVLPKDDPFWQISWPPNGYNCRCAVIPIYEQREVVLPRTLPGGGIAMPDDDFRYNPGLI